MAVFRMGKVTGMLYRFRANGTIRKADQLLWVYHSLWEFGQFPERNFRFKDRDAIGQSMEERHGYAPGGNR